jgi:multimeric flavodoxin WrbA
MNIIVLNGSPKGEMSVTMQYVRYLETAFPQHAFTELHIAQRGRALARDHEAFAAVIEQIRQADIVLWAFPLYYMLVHGNYKRFIEMIWERDATSAFKHKYTASLSTSIHFYDHTAHAYIQAISDDLDMHYTGAYSAEMHDLFEADKRDALVAFATRLLDAVERQTQTAPRFAPLHPRTFDYVPGETTSPVATRGKKVVILTDAEPHQANLNHMVARIQRTFGNGAEIINLHDVDIKGGCLGCLHCGYDNECAYEGKDGYIDMHRQRLQTADILIFAGAIRDRYLSATWKTFFDRSFFKTHTPGFTGKQFGWIVSGPLSQIQNLRQILEGWTQLERANLVGIVTDEFGDAAAIDGLLDNLAARSVRGALDGIVAPQTFLGIGGAKIFRDGVWGSLRTVFGADHRAYRRLGMYDFPQRDLRTRALNALTGVLLRIPVIRNVFVSRIKEGMVQPYRKLLVELKAQTAD